MSGSTKYKNNWQKDHLDRINLTMAKGQKEVVQAHAQAHDKSVTAFINRAIREAMERDQQMDALEQLVLKKAAENGISIENAREEARIIDALIALKPVLPGIKEFYLSSRYPQQKKSKLVNMNSPDYKAAQAMYQLLDSVMG